MNICCNNCTVNCATNNICTALLGIHSDKKLTEEEVPDGSLLFTCAHSFVERWSSHKKKSYEKEFSVKCRQLDKKSK